MMYDSRRSRYSRSLYRRSISMSLSRSPSGSRSRSRDSSDAENPGNNLYVTGLSSRVTKDELERHFQSEGKVTDVHLVVDPWTRESRGFGFVTMSSVAEADRCIKYLNRSVLEGRVITVEKARRRRGRTPTPGKYLGVRTIHERRRSPSYTPYYRSSSEGERSYTPYHDRRYLPPSRSPSPYDGRCEFSPASRRYRRSYSRDSWSYSRSISPYYRRRHPRSLSPRTASPRPRRRSYSRSVTPARISSRRNYSRSISPKRRSSRRYSPSRSPMPRRSKRGPSRSVSPRRSRGYSRESYSHSRSRINSRSRSTSGSPSRSA
ncbi:hypothetical protein Taro_014043 [Colocasia esculenta]|uniref:RRM domain-containing protein n=1 Tax=Colocasia esculenta TaxID=4460 RepID=A0A843UKN3_COLES|nr:hypothetical protein [Colocasia esculenta]